MTSSAAMGSEEIIAMVSEAGDFRIISVSLIQMSGAMTVSGSRVSANGRGFAGPGGSWPDGSSVGNVTIDGTLAQRTLMSGIYSTSTMESGSFELFYDELYERNSSLALLAGVWTAYDDLGSPEVTFTVQSTGGFNGQNAQGCTSNGQFSIIDARYDLYAVRSTVSGCPIAGDYSGFSLLADIGAANDAVMFAVDNGDIAILLGLQK
jgi:hypothetical protein